MPKRMNEFLRGLKVRKGEPIGVAKQEQAEPITVTTLPDGQHVAHLPLPERTVISPYLLGDVAGTLVETIITFRFANRSARYRVVDCDISGTLIAELVQEGEGRLPPLIEPDPATMQQVKRFGF